MVFALICQFRLLFKTSLQQPGLIAAQFCTQIPELREGKKNFLLTGFAHSDFYATIIMVIKTFPGQGVVKLTPSPNTTIVSAIL